MSSDLTIRKATLADASQLLAIYTPYILHTAITFEYTVPTLDEFTARMQKTLAHYPYFVAEKNGELLGYTYASPFKERAAYDWAVETTIYIRQNAKRSGIGTKLYHTLEDALRRQHITNANACIAYPNPESIAFHERLGYKLVAHFTNCGYKQDKWYDMVWLEKMLAEHTIPPLAVIPYPQLDR